MQDSQSAKVQVDDWGAEAWCSECGDGSGVTEKRKAEHWARKHNKALHQHQE